MDIKKLRQRIEECRINRRFGGGESPFCRNCGVVIDKDWRCTTCAITTRNIEVEKSRQMIVIGLKAAYNLAIVCDAIPYNGYGHCAWSEYFLIQGWLDDTPAWTTSHTS